MLPTGVPGQYSSYAPVRGVPGVVVGGVVDGGVVVGGVVVGGVVVGGVVVGGVVVGGVVVGGVVVGVVEVGGVVVGVVEVGGVVVGGVVVLAPVVVDVGSVSLPKRTVPMARSPTVSPMASTQSSPAATCAGVGGHGYSSASVAATPEVVQPGIVDVVVGEVVLSSTHVGAKPDTGGPVTPETIVCDPVKSPEVFLALEIVVRASAVQLTGMYCPKNEITGWLGSLLHCTMEAVAPGVNPVPVTVTTSPPASPLQMGSSTLVLSHDAPEAVTLSARVVPGVLTVDA